ncbi:hypothetical protein C1A50_2162 [Paenibacillus polymyxa]|nr:hypothetical protein C1A50_2162 [Paenibacillus polymyxa]
MKDENGKDKLSNEAGSWIWSSDRRNHLFAQWATHCTHS